MAAAMSADIALDLGGGTVVRDEDSIAHAAAEHGAEAVLAGIEAMAAKVEALRAAAAALTAGGTVPHTAMASVMKLSRTLGAGAR